MKIPEGLFNLLTDYKLPTKGFEVNNVTKKLCCENQIIEELPRREGYYCYSCGIVQREAILDNGFNEKGYERKQTFGAPVGFDTHYVVKSRRFYKPITHFKEHLRRYVGFRLTDIALKTKKKYTTLNDIAAQIDIDVKDRNAYFLVKEQLKKMKLNNLYKEIFCIIYFKGGVKPQISYDTFVNCVKDYENLVYHFFRNKEKLGRHSMPSVYMMLEILLLENGHKPYYNLPTLKDEKLRSKAMEIYRQIVQWKSLYDAHDLGEDETNV